MALPYGKQTAGMLSFLPGMLSFLLG